MANLTPQRFDVKDSQVRIALEKLYFAVTSIAKLLEPATRPDPWHKLALVNSWVNHSVAFFEAAYTVDFNGRVWLRGIVKSGAAATLANLPAEVRPKRECNFACISDTGIARVSVNAAGAIQEISGGTGYLSLDGISFDTRA